MKKVLIGITALLVASCGNQAEEKTETLQVMEGGIINALAGAVMKVLSPGESHAVGTLIGQAIPAGAESLMLSGGKEATRDIEKKVKSVLGANLVTLRYKISYRYGVKHEGKGAYITNVKFIPIYVDTDPLWSISVSALSDQPTNSGTAGRPVAKLGFSLTYTVKGLGSRAVTDEFEIDGATGKLKETLRELQPKD